MMFADQLRVSFALGVLALALSFGLVRAQEASELTPDWGSGQLTVAGAGFQPNERVELSVSIGSAEGAPVRQTFSVTADERGAFRLATGLAVPAGASVQLEAQGDQGTGMAAITSAPPPLGGPAAAGRTLGVQLEPMGGSGVTGTATIAAAGDAASVSVDLAGLSPDTSYPIALQAGTCAAPSASFGLLGTVQADAEGRAQLTATTARASAAGAPIDLTLSLLTDGDHIFSVRTADQGVVACGSIPGAAAPARPAAAGGPAVWAIAGVLGAVGLLGIGGGLLLRRR